LTIPTELRTTRLKLRQWLVTDRNPFALLNTDAQVMQHFPNVLSEEQSNAGADRIQAHIEKQGWGLWAVEIPGVTPFAGFIGLSRPAFEAHFTPCVEVGWRLAREFWGFGYASEGAAAALAFGFEHLGLSEIVSFTVPGNVRSTRVMERIGMIRNSVDDFDHPALPEGHPLRPHVLYRKARAPRDEAGKLGD
jgi:RimJ/RimL family protein N-acetyltransferase